MEARKFNIREDMPALCRWLYLHNCPILTPQQIPELGYIAYHDYTPVAAAFIRRVEGGYAQLDSLTSNPDCPGELRHIAIDLVVNQVLSAALDLGITKVMAFSTSESTLMRSLRHGFKKLEHSVIVLDLES